MGKEVEIVGVYPSARQKPPSRSHESTHAATIGLPSRVIRLGCCWILLGHLSWAFAHSSEGDDPVSALIAVDCVWSHCHRTSLFEARCSFILCQVPPAFSLTKPFPTMLRIKHRLLTAEQFHISAAHLLLLFHPTPLRLVWPPFHYIDTAIVCQGSALDIRAETSCASWIACDLCDFDISASVV